MKTADIEIGAEYAWSSAAYGPKTKVRVLEVGVEAPITWARRRPTKYIRVEAVHPAIARGGGFAWKSWEGHEYTQLVVPQQIRCRWEDVSEREREMHDAQLAGRDLRAEVSQALAATGVEGLSVSVKAQRQHLTIEERVADVEAGIEHRAVIEGPLEAIKELIGKALDLDKVRDEIEAHLNEMV